jgi:hypothetical protein
MVVYCPGLPGNAALLLTVNTPALEHKAKLNAALRERIVFFIVDVFISLTLVGFINFSFFIFNFWRCLFN